MGDVPKVPVFKIIVELRDGKINVAGPNDKLLCVAMLEMAKFSVMTMPENKPGGVEPVPQHLVKELSAPAG